MTGTEFIYLLQQYLQYCYKDRYVVGGSFIKIHNSWQATVFFTDASGCFPDTLNIGEEDLAMWENEQADRGKYEESF